MRALTLLAIALLGCRGDEQKCPDLNGSYVQQVEGGESRITVSQSACATVALETTSPYAAKMPEVHALSVDGIVHPDSGWFGDFPQQYVSAQFVRDSLRVVVRFGAGLNDNVITRVFYLTPSRDLAVETRDNSGLNPPAQIAKRVVAAP